eukprot:TRINITY_DN15235_c0_g1_i1.p1 TRINITY_DN15235_c0_g1~~TRINITY_DN15235_c0_g1_i1.p1  ORF type:complete len:207 (+),score=36.58 TRINITY_DN15235_c0_g1_i1:642-1262(+)
MQYNIPPICTLSVPDEQIVTALCYDKVFGYIVFASLDRVITVYDYINRKIVQTHSGHRDEIKQVLHIPEQHKYASVALDGTLRMWNSYMEMDKQWAHTGHKVGALAAAFTGMLEEQKEKEEQKEAIRDPEEPPDYTVQFVQLREEGVFSGVSFQEHLGLGSPMPDRWENWGLRNQSFGVQEDQPSSARSIALDNFSSLLDKVVEME